MTADFYPRQKARVDWPSDCPFCGFTPIVRGPLHLGDKWGVHCEVCNITFVRPTRGGAIRAWNTRRGRCLPDGWVIDVRGDGFAVSKADFGGMFVTQKDKQLASDVLFELAKDLIAASRKRETA